jgi:WD40 repeat protein
VGLQQLVHNDPAGYQAVALDEERGLVIAKEPQGPLHIIDCDSGEAVGQPLAAPALFRVGGLDVHDGLIAAGGSEIDGVSAIVYDIDSRARVFEASAEPAESAEVAFSPDSSRLAVTGAGRVRIFDVEEWTTSSTLATGDANQLPSVAWSADDSVLYAGGFSGTLFSWDVERAARDDAAEPARRAEVAVSPEPMPVTTITPVPNSNLLAVAPFDATCTSSTRRPCAPSRDRYPRTTSRSASRSTANTAASPWLR